MMICRSKYLTKYHLKHLLLSKFWILTKFFWGLFNSFGNLIKVLPAKRLCYKILIIRVWLNQYCLRCSITEAFMSNIFGFFSLVFSFFHLNFWLWNNYFWLLIINFIKFINFHLVVNCNKSFFTDFLLIDNCCL